MKLFFVAYGAGHIQMLEVTARELLNKKAPYEIVILALTSAYSQIKDKFPEGMVRPISHYKELFSSEINEILSYGEELVGENHNPNSGMTKEESQFYLGLSFWDLVQRHSLAEARELFAVKKRHAFYPLNVVRRIIQHEAPNLVITTSSPKCEQASIEVARELGIPSLQTIDTFEEVYPVPSADHIVVINEAVKQGFKKRGVQNEIYPLGHILLDETRRLVFDVDRVAVKNRLGLADRPTLTFTAKRLVQHDDNHQVVGELDPDLLNGPVFGALKNVAVANNINIIVRPHPNDNIDIYERHYRGDEHFYYFDKNQINLYESLAVSEFVLTYFSTVGMQSVAADRKVFTFKHPWPEHVVTQYTEKPFIFSEGFEELESTLMAETKNTSGPEASSFYEPGAVGRVCQLIDKILA